LSALTLVILTHNRAGELARTLERAEALPEKPPLIVVDNASRDGTAAMVAARFPRATLIGLEANIGAAARNAGVEQARTPYVAFSDDDTCWAPGSLECAEALLDAHPRVAAVTARVLVGAENREDPVSSEMAASPLPSAGLPGPSLLGFLAGASVFRRDAFLEAGGYEPRFFLGGEETLLAYDLAALGWSLVYAGELTVHHYPSAVRDSRTRRRLLARNAIWVAWLRRPIRSALRETLRRLTCRALADALPGLPWTLRHRRVLPRYIEAQCRVLERAAQAPGPCGRPDAYRGAS
jgi:GT2 family glycosyltransferase